jgi:hypothetical protein
VKTLTTYLVALATVIVAAPIGQAANPTPAELQALEIRGQAMNKLCSVPGRSAEAQQALCGSTRVTRPTAAELRALEIRGQAMNKLCSVPGRSAEAEQALCGKVGTANRPTAEELRALEIRGQALNGLCDTLSGEGYEAVCGRSNTVAIGRSANASGGIDWADFGIGAGAMLGLVLLSGGLLAGAYFGRKIGVRPRSVS